MCHYSCDSSKALWGVRYEVKRNFLVWRPRPSVSDLVSAIKSSVGFSWNLVPMGVLYKHFPGKHEFRENRLSENRILLTVVNDFLPYPYFPHFLTYVNVRNSIWGSPRSAFDISFYCLVWEKFVRGDLRIMPLSNFGSWKSARWKPCIT